MTNKINVVIDKKVINKITDSDKYEYIYIFDDESMEELIDLNMNCVHKNYIHTIEYVDINLTNYNIECLKKANINDKNWDNIPPKKDFKIAIIIPNYNYEEWIDKCLSSIANQTYKNYEVIFIDDVSTDNSVKIAETFKDKMNIKIVRLKQKRYNGGARNEAYLHLSDDVDYVWYVDSDDWITEDALEKINNKLQTRPDVLFIGMSEYNGRTTVMYAKPQYKDRYEAIEGWSGSCGKVIKKELATKQECLYNEGTLKEDKNQHRRICIYMKTFANLKDSIYVWNRTNTKSVTTIREKIMWGTSTIRHYADTLQLALSVKGKDKKIDEILEQKVAITKQVVESGGDKQF